MSSPTWHFDGDKRRMYEVPPGASYITDSNGYRIYDGGLSPVLMTTDVKKDLWSRWVDWQSLNDWALPALTVSGGSQRPTGEFSTADFSLATAIGWRIVLANYPHETIFYGNLFAQGADSLFDNSRLSTVGIVPRMQGSANLLTYGYSTSGTTGPTAEEVAIATVAALTSRIIENGYTNDDLMRLMASVLLGKLTGAGTGNEVFRDLSDTKNRITATVDNSGNRTAIALDVN